MANQSRQAPDGQSRYRGVSELPAASDGSVVGDYSAVIRDSQAAVLASAERITVVGRWVVLAAAAILNHLGNRNPASSVPIVDTILFLWSLVNLVVSVVLVRGYRPNRWFGFLTTGVDLLVATSILYFAGGYTAQTDFSLLFYLLIIASAVRLGLPGALATAVVVSLLYVFVGGLTGFPNFSPPPGFVIGRVFLFLFVALVAGLLVGNVLPGKGPIRTLRISAYSNDFTPLSGSGTLFELRMSRVSQAAQGTQLIWAAAPNYFIFIDADLKTQKPGNAAPGSVTPSGKR